jgi:hypothetical protein
LTFKSLHEEEKRKEIELMMMMMMMKKKKKKAKMIINFQLISVLWTIINQTSISSK